MGMLKAGGCLDLLQKPLGTHERDELGIHDLDGHLAVVAQVMREIDGRHAAGADFALDEVMIRDGGLEVIQLIAHSVVRSRAEWTPDAVNLSREAERSAAISRE